ncbi:MAG TPA: glycosyl hydrolase [Microlunatus sp.]
MASAPSLSELRHTFVNPPPEARPMMRGWWFGPEVSRGDIERDLTAMAAVGIGGVEVSYVYPLVEHSTRLGSDKFLADLAFAADVAESLGLRFDVTLGSGWSFGGPHIGPEHAARRLRWEHREIGPEALELAGGRQVWPGDELIGVYLGAGSLQEVPEAYASLPIGADGMVEVPPGTGTRVVLTATAGLTGQNVKRAAAGAEGPVHDHYDAAAVREHLTALGDRLIAAVGAHRLGSVFCDSLEVYHADWTPTLPEEFTRRRGYRPEPELWRLAANGPDVARFRTDYHRTLSELYEDNFLVPMAEWAHGHGVPLRVQSYGEPPATLASFRHVDGIEGEQWGWTRMPPTKWASSAAQHLGQPIVSSETWTWVHAPSFRATPLDLKGEAHEHFLLGINQLIGHGWPCSPRPEGADDGLGWFFYASAALDDRNAWWPAAPDLMTYLQRLSGLLRLGEPVRDLLLYLPTTDAYARLGTATSLDLWRTLAGMVDEQLMVSLRTAGYDFALLDDDTAAMIEPVAGLVVVLPGRVSVPAATRTWLHRVEAIGGRVLTVDEGDDAATMVGRHLAPDLTLHPTRTDVGMVHRRIGDLEVHLLVNTGPQARTQRVVPRDTRSRLEVWDPADGTVISATTDPGLHGIEIALAPYQALVLVGHDRDLSTVDARRSRPAPDSPRVALDTDWRLVRPDDTDLGEVSLPHRWEDDPRIGPHFSGTLAYVATITIPAHPGRVHLDLGDGRAADDSGTAPAHGIEGNSYRVQLSPPVGEVVRVLVDGEPVAELWGPPYACDLTDHLRHGKSVTLRLEVSNTTANALAADDTVAGWVADAERWHGRRFRMQALERVREGLSSGLLTVPELVLG